MMISNESFNILVACMRKFQPLEANFMIKLRPLLREIRFKRSELIFLKGVVPTFLPFIISGSARAAAMHPSTNEEETTWMWFENDFIFTNPGFFSEEPADFRIEAMEDVAFVYIERKDFVKFEKSFPMARKLTEMIRDYYLKLLNKYAFDLAVLSNQERFDQFVAAHPKAMTALTHQHIASFVGIRAKGLSRYANFNRK